MRLTSHQLAYLENLNRKKVEEGDTSMIGDLHALISGIKCLFTYWAVDGLETA